MLKEEEEQEREEDKKEYIRKKIITELRSGEKKYKKKMTRF